MREPLRWKLVLLLGAFALIRPVLRVTGVVGDDGLVSSAAGTVGATLLITFVWVVAVVQSRTGRPVMTLVLAGVAYAVLAAVLAVPLSVLLDSRLGGPIFNPFALGSMLLTNALWGAAVGCVAWTVVGLRARR